jgi:hypothetical protein
MPSSISSSSRHPRWHIVTFLTMAVVLCLGFEAVARYALDRSSLTHQRVIKQYRRAVQREASSGSLRVLLVGNSLLLAAIDPARLEEATRPSLTVAPLFLEATSYFDWLYGLRRLFREGARAEAVAVGLGPSQYLETNVRPDYFPWMLMDLRDALAVSRDVGLDRTAASNLVLGHFSHFWGTRGVIRSLVLRRALQDVERLMFRLNRRGRIKMSDGEYQAIAGARLERLRNLCAAHGARLVLVVPPAPDTSDDSPALRRIAERMGIDVLIPIPSGSLGKEYYEDDVHLNQTGAVRFTEAFAEGLRMRLGRLRRP